MANHLDCIFDYAYITMIRIVFYLFFHYRLMVQKEAITIYGGGLCDGSIKNNLQCPFLAGLVIEDK